MFKNCENCNEPFRLFPSEVGRARFCSKSCRLAFDHRAATEVIACKVCDTPFTTYKTTSAHRVTCSDDCARRARKKEGSTSKITIACLRCDKTRTVFPSRRNAKFCSVGCRIAYQAEQRTGTVRTSRQVPCDYCGKIVMRFKSRARAYHRAFCDNECYHHWDSWYKSQPEQQRKHAKRMMQSAARKTSKVEDRVARWLDDHGITYERQVNLIYRTMDFQVGNAYIEVQGCYWHGCPDCFILQTPRQRKIMSRDKAKATYCRRRSIPFYTIWEHDIRADNFSALAPLLTPPAV